MTIETEADVFALKRIGRIVSYVLQEMLDAAEPGMTTRELDSLGEQLLERHGARSAPRLTTELVAHFMKHPSPFPGTLIRRTGAS